MFFSPGDRVSTEKKTRQCDIKFHANESILDIKMHFKATETFQYTHFSSSHPAGVKKGFINGEALRLLRTNSSETTFKTALSNFKTHLKERGFPETLISTTLAEIRFEDRKLALQQRRKQNLRIVPFVTQYHPSVPNLKQILMQKWHLIQQQPLLNKIFKDPPMVAYKRGRSLKCLCGLQGFPGFSKFMKRT